MDGAVIADTTVGKSSRNLIEPMEHSDAQACGQQRAFMNQNVGRNIDSQTCPKLRCPELSMSTVRARRVAATSYM